MATGVVLLAAGDGRRFGGRVPKQFAPLNGEPLFMKSLRTFLRVPSVKDVVVVASRPLLAKVKNVLGAAQISRSVRVVEGGPYRGASVRNGLLALAPDIDVVLIHDSARPLISPAAVRRVENAALKTGAALAAWPLPDTLKLCSPNGRVQRTIPRRRLWLAQTPQGFRRNVALKCLLRPSRGATDDVQLAERRGYTVRVVEGSAINFKITFPHDLAICRALVR